MRPRLNFPPVAPQPTSDQHERRARFFLRCRVAALLLFIGAYLNVMVAWGCAIASPLSSVYLEGFGLTARVWTWRSVTPTESPEDRARRPFSRRYGQWLGTRIEYNAGWPMHSLQYDEQISREHDGSVRFADRSLWRGGIPYSPRMGELGRLRRLPLKPIVPGFIFNSIVYSAVFAIPYLLTLPSTLRRASRRRRGRCAFCNYNRRGLPPDMLICPECGHADHNAPVGCHSSVLLPHPPPAGEVSRASVTEGVTQSRECNGGGERTPHDSRVTKLVCHGQVEDLPVPSRAPSIPSGAMAQPEQ